MDQPGSPAKLVVVWRVTETCNLGCHFCAYSRHLERRRLHAGEDEVLRIGEVLADWQRRTGRQVLVSWLGGEPFLWKPLAALSARFRQLGLRLGATTNGTPLRAPALRRQVARDFAELTISLDGIGGFNDWCRDRPGLYAAVGEIITQLRAEGDRPEGRLLIKVNTILMRGNVAAFPELCEALAGWGVDEVTFNQLGGNDRPEFYPPNRLLPAQVEGFVERFEQVRLDMATRGLRVHGSPQYLHRLRCTSLGVKLPIEDCRPGSWFLFIDEEGRVAPCSFTVGDYGLPIAGIRGPEDIDLLPSRFAGLRAARRAAPCLDCHSTQVFEKFS